MRSTEILEVLEVRPLVVPADLEPAPVVGDADRDAEDASPAVRV